MKKIAKVAFILTLVNITTATAQGHMDRPVKEGIGRVELDRREKNPYFNKTIIQDPKLLDEITVLNRTGKSEFPLYYSYENKNWVLYKIGPNSYFILSLKGREKAYFMVITNEFEGKPKTANTIEVYPTERIEIYWNNDLKEFRMRKI